MPGLRMRAAVLAAAVAIGFPVADALMSAADACCHAGGGRRESSGRTLRQPSRPPPPQRVVPRQPTRAVNPALNAARRNQDRGRPEASPPPQEVVQRIEQEAGRVAGEHAWRDSVWSRVFGNLLTGNWPQSCVDASEARARDIAAALQRMHDRGRLGDYSVTVGVRSGYQVAGNSFHTYSVIEVRDADG